MHRREIVAFLEERFPLDLAEEWDHCGLEVGDLASPCRRVLVVLDLEMSHLKLLPQVDLVVTHHPLLFRPVSEIRVDAPLGQKLKALLSADVALFSLHTPYDSAQGGLGEVLAGYLGLKNVEPLLPRGKLLKLVVYVPAGYEERVAQAIFAAGAGKLGKYGHCSFRTQGIGTFLIRRKGLTPSLGRSGKRSMPTRFVWKQFFPRRRWIKWWRRCLLLTPMRK
jgi:putative NIF3 family GTP cyclohydrolase 1 type 2